MSQQPPSEDEIAALPRWARGAYAARCARRVLPLYRHCWASAPAEHVTAVVRAVELAEEAARNASAERDRAAIDAAFNASNAATLDRTTGTGDAACDAGRAAGYALGYPDHSAHYAVSAALRAAASFDVRGAIRADFEALSRKAATENWADDTPVPPETFGLMWPDGTPVGWPTQPARVGAEVPGPTDPIAPTEAEVEELPHWARVAFAARCARRVLPLYRHFHSGAPRRHIEAVTAAIDAAERAAATARAIAIPQLTVDGAAFGARAVRSSAEAAAAPVGRVSAEAAARAVAAATDDVANALYTADDRIARRAIRTDFDRLTAAAAAYGWTDGVPVPPTVFGPMWPDGPPPHWPKEEERPEPLGTPSADAADEAPELPSTREQSPSDARRVLAAHTGEPGFLPGDRVPHAELWELVDPLGKGGFGQVWRVRHRGTGEERAVKFCFHPTARDRLTDVARHESKVVQHVQKHMREPGGDHPNVVPLRDCNLTGTCPWLMYEYVPGGRTLADVIRELQDLPVAERVSRALPLLGTIARAVGVFHRLNVPIVHRDLTPRNVLMAGGIPRITDFGIGGAATTAALEDATGLTEFTVRVPTMLRSAGTPPHASPQQLAGADPDPRDDVYALGVMAYQMLTGELSAPGADARDKLEELDVPDALIRLIVKSVSAPDRRSADAGAWAEALSPLLPSAANPLASLQVNVTVPGLWFSSPADDPKADWVRLGFSPRQLTFESDREYLLRVHIDATESEFEGLIGLAVVPMFKELELQSAEELSPTVLAHFAPLIHLRALDLGDLKVSDAGLAHLSRLTELERLSFGAYEVTDAGLASLAGLSGLHVLHLSLCPKLTDAGLKHLTRLSRLHSLELSMSHVTDCGLEGLSAFPHLQTLDLHASAGISGPGLQHLASLPDLQELDLSFCLSLTDVGVKHLAALTALRHLKLSHCERVTEEAVATLQAALPACVIERRA